MQRSWATHFTSFLELHKQKLFLKNNSYNKSYNKCNYFIYGKFIWTIPIIDQFFILAKKYIPGKSILQLVKLQSLVAKCCKMQFGLQSSQILYTFVLRAEIATTFAPKTVAISARNTKVYKICKLCSFFFFAFYNISQPNFAILLILVRSFQLW